MKFRRSMTGALLLSSVSLALAACDDLIPTFIDGTFELTRVEGRALPHTLWEYAGERAILVAERLTFDPDGSVLRETTIEYQGGTQDRVETNGIPMEYRLDRRRIEVGWFTPCPPNAMCLANDVGRAELDRVLLSSSTYGGGQGAILLEFERRE